MSNESFKKYKRTGGEFKEQLKMCKTYKVREILRFQEGKSATIVWSRVYKIDDKTMRTMASTARKELVGLAPGFILEVGDLICISPDGTTSIQKLAD